MSALGLWLKGRGFTVDDANVPLGRTSTWRQVEFLMVHHTASDCAGSESSMAAFCRTGGSAASTSDIAPLCQIFLGGSGKVWMTCRERPGQHTPGRASHAGQGHGYGVPQDTMNERCLGIECQCRGNHPLATHAVLYRELIELLAALARHYQVPTGNIIGHKEWSSTGKVDPKDDMNKIRADVAAQLKKENAMVAWAIGSRQMVKKATTVTGGAWAVLATIDLPKGASYTCSLQVRMPAKVTAGEVVLGRRGWGTAKPGELDETAGNAIAGASSVRSWRTPIDGHNIVGGGPLEFRLWLPAGTHAVSFVAKAVRIT